MPIVVCTDPHLGKNLISHTTQDSRRRLRNGIFNHTQRTLERFNGSTKVCLGDLFDRFQNSEEVILQGVAVTRGIDFLMGGNHDLVNDRDRVGSLQMLQQMNVGRRIMLSPFGESSCYLEEVAPGVNFLFVPHHSTDDLFQTSLKDAAEWVVGKPAGTKAYLCLHCNYDSGFATDDTALSLTRKQARDLLDEGFDHILIGHDHHPREDWEGGVVILGNMHPTGFGDITAKRVLVIEDDGSHRFESIWEPNGSYAKVTVEQLLDGSDMILDMLEGASFVEIVGEVSADRVMDLARGIRKIWLTAQPFAVRNRVEVTRVGGEPGDVVGSHEFQDIDKLIREELGKRPDLVAQFDEYWAQTAPTVTEED